MSLVRRHRWLQGLLLMGPAAAWIGLFVFAPTAIAIAMSFWRIANYRLVHQWNLDNYTQFLHTAVYHDPLWTSLENGAIAAFACVALSIPLAHFIRFRIRHHRMFFFSAVVIGLWLGYLLRIFGWRIALGQDGIINGVLQGSGITHHPISWLIFSRFAVILVQTHLAMPFAFIPIYAAMERVPDNLMQASADLGATRRRQLVHVELPLISVGAMTGATFAFVLAFGDYFAPTLVGDPSSQTIGNVAADQFGEAFQWPLGAAIGVVMIIVVLLVVLLPAALQRLVAISRRFDRRDTAEAMA